MMHRLRKYRVEGTQGGSEISFAEVTGYNGQQAFRKIKRKYPQIENLKAYRLDDKKG